MPQICPEPWYDSPLQWPPRRFPGVGHEPKEQKMKLDRRTVLAGTAAAFAAPLLSAMPARADAKRQSLVDSCLESARKVLDGKDFPDAAKNMTNAKGVLIVPELVQGGFFIGAAGGRGTLMARNGAKDWSPPAFYGMGSGSFGLQIGAKVSEMLFIIRTDKGLAAILDHGHGRRHRGLRELGRPVRRRFARRLLSRRRQRLERALLRPGRHHEGDRARSALQQSGRRADPPVSGEVVRLRFPPLPSFARALAS